MLGATSRLSRKAAYTVREIYRPILRGYFGVFAAYYLLMVPSHFAYLSGVELFNMGTAALVAAVVGLVGVWQLRKPQSPRRLELLLSTLNLMVVCNVYIALSIEFSVEKLTYFIIAAMLFALASVSFRQSVLSIGIAFMAGLTFVPQLSDAALTSFAFLVFGAAMASLAIAFFLRKAITTIAKSKLEAEERLEEARIAGDELRAKSMSDSLTELPNRRAFFAQLRTAMRKSAESIRRPGADIHVWLFLLDLDGFKAVNDIHGHLTGDLLLKEVSDRLRDVARDRAHVSRMGGDEFNIIVETTGGEASILRRAKRLLHSLSSPYIIEGRHVRISASVGCKKLELGESTRQQISEADYALMVAKKEGKNRVVLFDADHARDARERQEVEEALRCADLSHEIKLVYQPQVDLETQAIVRAEALVRWESPVLGSISPEHFIKIAEESGLITGISLQVVEMAFAELATWQDPVPLSINLSSHDLMSDPTVDQILKLATDAKIDQQLVEFEVTETAMMADFDKATANLERLAAAGFSIALDDFGTGYSNFSYLRALPITKLKVDRSFIDNPGDPMTEKILSSLAGMARTLGVHCLLEGVEDELDLLMAKRAGAEFVQGYLFGKPMSATDLRTMIDARASEQGAEAA